MKNVKVIILNYKKSINLICDSLQIKLFIKINDRKIVNIKTLNKAHSVNTSYSNIVMGLERLGKIKNLNLMCCNNIFNTNLFGNLVELDITHCDRVESVSNLKCIKKLNIRGCIFFVENIDALLNLEKLLIFANINNLYKKC